MCVCFFFQMRGVIVLARPGPGRCLEDTRASNDAPVKDTGIGPEIVPGREPMGFEAVKARQEGTNQTTDTLILMKKEQTGRRKEEEAVARRREEWPDLPARVQSAACARGRCAGHSGPVPRRPGC